MKSKAIVVLAVLVFLIGSAVPSDAARGGGRSHGGSHGGFHGTCCWWGPGAVIGGLALGAALAYPYYARPYYAYPYYTNPYYAYPYYAPPAMVAPPVVYQQQPQTQPTTAYQQPSVQREVVYPNGKYVLYGDGVTQPWEWVWVAAPR